jgi:hypothetical protein
MCFWCHAHPYFPVLGLIVSGLVPIQDTLLIVSLGSLSYALCDSFGGAYADKHGCKSAIALGIKLMVVLLVLFTVACAFREQIGKAAPFVVAVLSACFGVPLAFIDGADTGITKQATVGLRGFNINDAARLEGICTQLKYAGIAFTSFVGCLVYSAFHALYKLPAGVVQESIATFTHVGIGTVRTRPCFPTRSTTHHRPSRRWMCLNVSAATSERRSPQQRSTARIARSRNPFIVVASGAFSSACACFAVSQFPRRTPFEATPFTRVIPLANSGASSPLSAASTANFRTAVIRPFIETAPSPRASNATRQAATVALVKPGRDSWPYHSKNSSSPRLYTRFVIGKETESRTKDFNRRQSAPLSTTANSFILGALNGHYRCHVTLARDTADIKQNDCSRSQAAVLKGKRWPGAVS